MSSKDSLAVGASVPFNINGTECMMPPLPLHDLYTALSAYRLEKKREAVAVVKDIYTPAEMSAYLAPIDRELEAIDVTDERFMSYLFSRSDGVSRILHLTLESCEKYRGRYTQPEILKWLLSSREDDGLGLSLQAWLKASGLGGDESTDGGAAGEPGERDSA